MAAEQHSHAEALPRLAAEPRPRSSNSPEYRTPRTLPVGPATELILTACHEPARCPNHAVVLLESHRDHRRVVAAEVDCRRLRCPVCSVRRRGLWLGHFYEKIAEAADTGQSLFVVRVDPGRPWHSMQRTIRRRKGEFARVLTTGDAVVVTTAQVDDSTPVNAGVAVEALAVAMEELPPTGGRQKPISASAGWRLHERRGGRYVCRGIAPRGGFPAVMRQALEAGLRPRVHHGESGKRGGWWFPDHWTSEERVAFFDELAIRPVLRTRAADTGPVAQAI